MRITSKYEFIYIIFKYFAFQGNLYKDKTEITLHFILEIIIYIGLLFVLININLFQIPYIILMIFISHLIMLFINGHFWTPFYQYGIFKNGKRIKERITHFINFLLYLKKFSSLEGCYIFGSLSRGEYSSTSDIDIRLLRFKGIINGFSSFFITQYIRLYALFHIIPIDIYLADNETFFIKLRQDEMPIIIFNKSNIILKNYSKSFSHNYIVSQINNLFP